MGEKNRGNTELPPTSQPSYYESLMIFQIKCGEVWAQCFPEKINKSYYRLDHLWMLKAIGSVDFIDMHQ